AAAEIARDHERVLADLLGRAFGDDATRLHRVHAVAQAHEQWHVVLDDEDGAVELVPDAAKKWTERLGLALGDAGGGLVEEEQLRRGRHLDGQVTDATRAGRELGRQRVRP